MTLKKKRNHFEFTISESQQREAFMSKGSVLILNLHGSSLFSFFLEPLVDKIMKRLAAAKVIVKEGKRGIAADRCHCLIAV
jgi:hypothetical protein